MIDRWRSASWYHPGKRVLVACSGGVDSTTLLTLFHENLDLHLVVAHFDHGLREESGGDAQFVGHLAHNLGIAFLLERLPIRETANRMKWSLEETGHHLRRQSLLELAGRENCEVIALGHNANDLTESLLLNLANGTGIRGLALGDESEEIFIRPFGTLSRAQIESLAGEFGVPYREDTSNRDLRFRRNQIRHVLLPRLEGGDHLTSILGRLIQHAGCLQDRIDKTLHLIDNQHIRVINKSKILFVIDGASLYFDSVYKGLFDRLLKGLNPEFQGLGERHFRLLSRMVRVRKPGQCVHLPHGIQAWNETGGILFVRHMDYQWETHGSLTTGVTTGWFRILVEESACPDRAKDYQDANRIWMAAPPESLHIRAFRRGDRMVPMGSKREVTVSKLLSGRKVDHHLRKIYPVVTEGEKIVWVPGICAGEGFRWSAARSAGVRTCWCLKFEWKENGRTCGP